MSDDPTPQSSALRCIRCGYELTDLVGPPGVDGMGSPTPRPRRAELCPECGTPVERSLPEARPGTPWQRSRSVRALLATNVLTVTRPWRVVRIARPHRTSAQELVAWNIGTTTVALFVSVVIFHAVPMFARSLANGTMDVPNVIAGTAFAGIIGIGIYIAIGGIALIYLPVESFLLRLWHRYRGVHVAPEVTLTIAAHATCAPTAAALLLPPVALLGALLSLFNDDVASAVVVAIGPVAIAWIVGPMLFMELFGYFGTRALKHATPWPEQLPIDLAAADVDGAA